MPANVSIEEMVTEVIENSNHLLSFTCFKVRRGKESENLRLSQKLHKVTKEIPRKGYD